MEYGSEIDVAGDWFKLHFLENPGMAFGAQFQDIPLIGKYLKPQIAKPLLTLFRIGAVIFIIYLIKRMILNKAPKGLLYCMALILAGALGNIIDSTFYGLLFDKGLSYSDQMARWVSYSGVASPNFDGYAKLFNGTVVDMFYFPLVKDAFWPEWVPIVGGRSFEFFRPVFNLADASISVGVFIILLFNRTFFSRKTT